MPLIEAFLPFAVGIAAAFLVTYLGAHVWITKQIQPYRFVMPLAYLTIVPASAFLVEVARSGVDFISVGAITHSAPVADFSLRLQPEQT